MLWRSGLLTYLSSWVTESMLGISLSRGDWRLEVAECRRDLGGLNFDTSILWSIGIHNLRRRHLPAFSHFKNLLIEILKLGCLQQNFNIISPTGSLVQVSKTFCVLSTERPSASPNIVSSSQYGRMSKLRQSTGPGPGADCGVAGVPTVGPLHWLGGDHAHAAGPPLHRPLVPPQLYHHHLHYLQQQSDICRIFNIFSVLTTQCHVSQRLRGFVSPPILYI